MARRSHPLATARAFLPLLALPLVACAPDRGPRRVILITCDTLRADRLGHLGYPRPTSPELDRLASEALVFESAWSTAPLTGPSLSALHTGRLPEELGLADNRNVLSAEATTLAEVLSDAGITTGAVVSNWVLRRRAELPGAGVEQGFEHFDDRMDVVERNRPQLKERLASATTDAALEWLAGRAPDEPFFLWVHYQDPHGPYTPPEDCLPPLARELTDEPELPVGRNQRGHGDLPIYQVLGAERAPETYRMRYDAEIRYFDRELGRLLAQLRSSGILQRSLLIFSADHGEALGEHGYYFAHGQNLHAELLHVPLLVRLPGGERAGERRSEPVSHLDLWPTVLAAFDLEPGPCRGLDLLADALPAERVLAHSRPGEWGATDAHHRLIAGEDGVRLYHRERDPLELSDLAASDPARVEELAQRYREFLARASRPPIRAAEPRVDAQVERELDALGYGGDER
jgi:arylsulfatase